MYKNASYSLAGGVALVTLANEIIWYFSESISNPAVPGFHYLVGLITPLLCLWCGILIRIAFYKVFSPSWWIKTIVTCVTLFFLVNTIIHSGILPGDLALFLTMMGLGSLIPPKRLERASELSLWRISIPTLIAVFCYVAVVVTRRRLLWGDVMPDYPDMEMVLEVLMDFAELGMLMLCMYFIVQIAFSKEGVAIGEKKWVRWAVIILSVLQLRNVLVFIGHWHWFELMVRTLVQPATVGLIYLICKGVGRLKLRADIRRIQKEMFEDN